jgi:hypothetical protein
VIELEALVEPAQVVQPRWTEDAPRRLAAAVAADPSVELTASDIERLPASLEPIVTWALAIQDESDDTAVRRGVHVAATRALLGLPRHTILVAFHELPTILARETGAPTRIGALAIEVGLRLRRLPAGWDAEAAD